MRLYLSLNLCFIFFSQLDGCYMAKAGYKWLCGNNDAVTPRIWCLKAPEKSKFSFGMLGTSLSLLFLCFITCARCNSTEETILHCLRDYQTLQRLWRAISFRSNDFFSQDDEGVWIRTGVDGPNLSLFVARLWCC